MGNMIFWGIVKLLIGFAIGFIFKDYIKEKLYFIVIALSRILGRRSRLNGLWLANFKYPDITSDKLIVYNEVIHLYCVFNFVVGIIVPHKQNGARAKELSSKKPLRLMGVIKDNTHFTGSWYHPEENFSYYGSFQLTISPNNKIMNGRWLGFNTKRDISCNEWKWEKIGMSNNTA